MKHITDPELARRITINLAERTNTHNAMLGPGCTPLVNPLSEEWADLSKRYDALAGQSDALYNEQARREAERATEALNALRRKLAGV
jgi:hypothetical protein